MLLQIAGWNWSWHQLNDAHGLDEPACFWSTIPRCRFLIRLIRLLHEIGELKSATPSEEMVQELEKNEIFSCATITIRERWAVKALRVIIQVSFIILTDLCPWPLEVMKKQSSVVVQRHQAQWWAAGCVSFLWLGFCWWLFWVLHFHDRYQKGQGGSR